MEPGKLLITLTISVGLLSGCTSNKTMTYNSHSTYASTVSDYKSPSSTLGLLANYTKWSVNRMNANDRKQQEQAVFFALNTLAPGEMTKWYNGNTGAHGAVQVAMTYPQGSGYCKVLMSQIVYNGNQRDFSETACVNSVDNTWRFVR